MAKKSKKKGKKLVPQNSTPPSEEKRLTKAGEKLLFVLSEPEHYLLSVTKLCEKAKIDRKTYYNLYKTEEFTKASIELAKSIFSGATPSVAHKVAKQAIEGSLAHQEIILEATGVVQPKGIPAQQSQQVNIFTRLGKEADEFIEGEEVKKINET